MKRFANGVLNVIAKIIAVLCAVFFVATTLAALLLFNVERRAFNPNPYKAALANEDFYQRLPPILGQALAKDASQSNMPFARQLSSENWATIVQTLLPPAQLRAMTEDAITQIFAYLNNETSNPQVSLLPLKQRLSSSRGIGCGHQSDPRPARLHCPTIGAIDRVVRSGSLQSAAGCAYSGKANSPVAIECNGGRDSRSNIIDGRRQSIPELKKSPSGSIHHATQSTHPAGILIWDYDLRRANIQRLAGVVGLAVSHRRRDRRAFWIQRRAIVSYRPRKFYFVPHAIDDTTCTSRCCASHDG